MQSRQALETAIVRAAFDGHDAVHRITSQIRADDITDLPMRRVFGELVRLTDSGTPLDPVLVVQGLVTHSTVPDRIALETVVDLSGAHWESAHIDHYCDTLRRYAAADAVQSIGVRLAGEESVDESVIDSYVALLNDAKQSRSTEIATMRDAIEAAEFIRKNPLAVHGTGLSSLDHRLSGGIRDGQMITVGGRPGTGKSILLMQLALASALRGEPALIISLEMLKAEIVERLARHQHGRSLSRLPMYFIDTTSDLDSVVSLTRSAVRRYGIRMIVFDYLQLAECHVAKGTNREQQISTISRRLKRLALDVQVPVIAGSQLNRDSLKRGKPTLADLRESGSIEQDSDIVLLLHPSEDGTETQLIVAKNRAGSTGVVQLTLHGAEYRFEDSAVWTGNL